MAEAAPKTNPGSRISRRNSNAVLWVMVATAAVAMSLYSWLVLKALFTYLDIAKSNVGNESYSLIALVAFKTAAGFFGGALLALGGLGVSFFTNTTSTDIEGDDGDHKVRLATASPGIVAILAGTLIIYHSISQVQKLSVPVKGSSASLTPADASSMTEMFDPTTRGTVMTSATQVVKADKSDSKKANADDSKNERSASAEALKIPSKKQDQK